MDPVTAMTLDKGRKNTRLLVQPQYTPMPVGEEVTILYCGTHGLLRDVPLDKVNEFQDNFLQIIRTDYKESVLDILESGKITDEVCHAIEKVASDISAQFKN